MSETHELHQQADAIAAALGDGWRRELDPDETPHTRQVRLYNDAAGALLCWWAPDSWRRGNARLEIHAGPLERLADGLYMSDRGPASITVAASRPAPAIASEIKRRLLPPLIEHVAKVKERNAEAARNVRRIEETAEALRALLRVEVKPASEFAQERGDHARVYYVRDVLPDCTLKVKIRSDCRIEFESFTLGRQAAFATLNTMAVCLGFRE